MCHDLCNNRGNACAACGDRHWGISGPIAPRDTRPRRLPSDIDLEPYAALGRAAVTRRVTARDLDARLGRDIAPARPDRDRGNGLRNSRWRSRTTWTLMHRSLTAPVSPHPPSSLAVPLPLRKVVSNRPRDRRRCTPRLLSVTLFRRGFLGLFLIERDSICHIDPSSSES